MEEEKKILKDRLFWVSMLLSALILILSLWYGFSGDQAIYAYGAWVWKKYHLAPYLGAWDGSLPGIFIIHRLEMAIFGESILGFRAFDCLVQLGAAGMLFWVARKISGSSRAGFFSSTMYSIYYIEDGFWGVGQRDGFVFVILLLALVLGLTLQSRRWLRAVLVGLLAGFAFLIKPTYGLSWIVFGAWFFYEGIQGKRRSVYGEVLVYSVCCFLPGLILALGYWRLGHIDELYRLAVLYNLKGYAGARSAAPISDPSLAAFWIAHSILKEQPLILCSGILALFLKLKNEDRDAAKMFWVIFSLVMIGLASYLIQGKYNYYHLIPFWGFLLIFAGGSLNWILTQLVTAGKALRGSLVPVLFYLFLAGLMVGNADPERIVFVFKYCFRGLDRAYLSGLGSYPDAQLATHYLTADYLKPLLRPEDQVEVFARHPLIPYLLRKKLPSRFCVVTQLAITPPGKPTSDLQNEWIREYTRDVMQARPEYFVVAEEQISLSVDLSYPSIGNLLHEKFPELEKFLAQNYQPLRKIGDLEIYQWAGP